MGSTGESYTAWQQEPDVSDSLAVLKQGLSEEALNGPDGRRKLLEATRSLSSVLETPGESVQRLAYLVRFCPWVACSVAVIRRRFLLTMPAAPAGGGSPDWHQP